MLDPDRRLICCYVPYTGPWQRITPGPRRLTPDAVARHQRLRIFQAYAELLREAPPR